MDENLTRIPDDHLRDVASARRDQRGQRRAAAINAVQLARAHAGRTEADLYSQSEADVIMAITELLDRVAET